MTKIQNKKQTKQKRDWNKLISTLFRAHNRIVFLGSRYSLHSGDPRPSVRNGQGKLLRKEAWVRATDEGPPSLPGVKKAHHHYISNVYIRNRYGFVNDLSLSLEGVAGIKDLQLYFFYFLYICLSRTLRKLLQSGMQFSFFWGEMLETAPSSRWRYVPTKDGTDAICQL